MKIHCLQHVPFEGPGAITVWAREYGAELSTTRFFAGDALPVPGAHDLVVVLGGPMSVHDQDPHPWLRDEQRYLQSVIASGGAILGICLGAQLLARTLRARVYKNPHKEIGWFPVTLSDEARDLTLFKGFPIEFMPFHWHGETFDLPADAIPIGSSTGCRQQGFAYGERVLALQFHLEITAATITELVRNCARDLTPGDFVQSPAEMKTKERLILEANELLFALLGRLLPVPH